MAIWQIPLDLISNNTISFSDLPFLNSVQNLATIFPEEKSWCAFIKQYGNIEQTCLEILLNGDVVENISLRLSLLDLSKQHLYGICEFATANNLYIRYESEVYSPTIDNFQRIIRQSNAHKFLSDPFNYLDSI